MGEGNGIRVAPTRGLATGLDQHGGGATGTAPTSPWSRKRAFRPRERRAGEGLRTVASWPSLLLVVVVFGFAPGLCLRLIVLAYPREDSRRDELIAELYAVPRIQRPLWVPSSWRWRCSRVSDTGYRQLSAGSLVGAERERG